MEVLEHEAEAFVSDENEGLDTTGACIRNEINGTSHNMLYGSTIGLKA